jgi:hypothetical protein
VGKLFAAAVTVITVISAALFATRTWWMPADLSVLGHGIDGQLTETMIYTGVLFVAAQLALALFVWQSSTGAPSRVARRSWWCSRPRS